MVKVNVLKPVMDINFHVYSCMDMHRKEVFNKHVIAKFPPFLKSYHTFDIIS